MQAVSASSGVVSLVADQFTPSNLGDRPAQIAPAFLRFRFKSLKVKYQSNIPTTYFGTLAMSIADDSDSTATTPSTAAQLVSMRISKQFHAYSNAVLNWRPIDKDKWYYINNESTANDNRFTIPSTLFIISDQSINLAGSGVNGVVGIVDVHYVIEFSGATNVAV